MALHTEPRPLSIRRFVALGLAHLVFSFAGAGCSNQDPRYHAQVPARAAATPRPPGKVLFVLSAARQQVLRNGKRRRTGNFLNEVYEPYLALQRAGYQVVAATPGGCPPSLDPESLDTKYWSEHPEHLENARHSFQSPPLMEPMALADALARHSEFQGMLVPGGQGLMVDLLDDARVHALLLRFASSDRPIGLICHAPALLTRAATPAALRGRQVTSVSGFEEFYIETFVMGGAAQVRDIGDQLAASGFAHATAFPGRAHAVRDCNLVTSQNPFSGSDFSGLYLAALADFRRGARCVPTRAP